MGGKKGTVWVAPKNIDSNITFLLKQKMEGSHDWNMKREITKYGFTETKGRG